MSKATFDTDQLPALTDILMAGAYADDNLDGREVKTVRKMLVDAMKDADELPDELQDRIERFRPGEFDLEVAVARLGKLDSVHRRAVLEMLADLSEADDEIDMQEDEFLRQVAAELGAKDTELKGLTVEIEIITKKRQPPPPPKLPKK